MTLLLTAQDTIIVMKVRLPKKALINEESSEYKETIG